jgi:hypothetical protein
MDGIIAARPLASRPISLFCPLLHFGSNLDLYAFDGQALVTSSYPDLLHHDTHQWLTRHGHLEDRGVAVGGGGGVLKCLCGYDGIN